MFLFVPTDLIEDWSSKSTPDIFHFYPYTWRFSFLLKEFELLTVVNEWNWIDCGSMSAENSTYFDSVISRNLFSA